MKPTVDITVGSGTSVIEFELNNFGYIWSRVTLDCRNRWN